MRNYLVSKKFLFIVVITCALVFQSSSNGAIINIQHVSPKINTRNALAQCMAISCPRYVYFNVTLNVNSASTSSNTPIANNIHEPPISKAKVIISGVNISASISIKKGSTGNISWTPIGMNNLSNSYYIYKNNSLIDFNDWTSVVAVHTSINNLTAGNYLYSIQFHYPNTSTAPTTIIFDDSMVVSPSSSSTPGFEAPLAIFSFLIIGIFIVIRKNSRKKDNI